MAVRRDYLLEHEKPVHQERINSCHLTKKSHLQVGLVHGQASGAGGCLLKTATQAHHPLLGARCLSVHLYAINGSDCKAFEGEVCGLQLRWLLVRHQWQRLQSV